MDWADEIEINIADEYGSHGAVLAADADGMIAAALRKAKADGEIAGQLIGLRFAVQYPHLAAERIETVNTRASQIEKGQT